MMAIRSIYFKIFFPLWGGLGKLSVIWWRWVVTVIISEKILVNYI